MTASRKQAPHSSDRSAAQQGKGWYVERARVKSQQARYKQQGAKAAYNSSEECLFAVLAGMEIERDVAGAQYSSQCAEGYCYRNVLRPKTGASCLPEHEDNDRQAGKCERDEIGSGRGNDHRSSLGSWKRESEGRARVQEYAG
jgi:hypothetical protein